MFFKIKQQICINMIIAYAIITLLIIFSISFFTFYWADDYCLLLDLNKKGVLQNSIDGYFNWDGRMLTITGIFQGFSLKYLPIHLITFIWSLSFLISSSLIFFIIDEELNLKIENKNIKILIILFTTITFWVGGYSHFSETIYWGTGGCYSFSLLLGSIWVLFFLRIQKFQISNINKFLFLIFSFFIGALTQNLTLALLSLTAVSLIINYLKKIKSINNNNHFVLIFLTLGLVYLSIAPGNFIRMEAAKAIKIDFFSIFLILLNFAKITIHYIIYCFVLIFVSSFTAFFIYKLSNPNSKFVKFKTFKFPKNKIEIADFLINFKWLLVALSTVIPFTFMPNLASKRTVIYFSFFIILFIFTFLIKLFENSISIKSITQSTSTFNKILIYFTFTLVISSFFAIYNLKKGIILKSAITERENYLKNSKGKTAYIKLIDPNLKAPCFMFTDFFINLPIEDDFILSSQQEYFKVKIVVNNFK